MTAVTSGLQGLRSWLPVRAIPRLTWAFFSPPGCAHVHPAVKGARHAHSRAPVLVHRPWGRGAGRVQPDGRLRTPCPVDVSRRRHSGRERRPGTRGRRADSGCARRARGPGPPAPRHDPSPCRARNRPATGHGPFPHTASAGRPRAAPRGIPVEFRFAGPNSPFPRPAHPDRAGKARPNSRTIALSLPSRRLSPQAAGSSTTRRDEHRTPITAVVRHGRLSSGTP